MWTQALTAETGGTDAKLVVKVFHFWILHVGVVPDEPAESLRGGGQSHVSACQHNTVVSNKEIKRVSVTDSRNAGSCAPHTHWWWSERRRALLRKGLEGG